MMDSSLFYILLFYLTDLPIDPSERDSFEINVQCKLQLFSTIIAFKPNSHCQAKCYVYQII